jgi:hypothetical protein
MSIPLNPDAGWRTVATIEVIDEAPVLLDLISDDDRFYRLEKAPSSPQGCTWFDVVVDFSVGDRRAAHTAYLVLSSLRRAADRGYLHSYRLVNGDDWLKIGARLERDDPIVDAPGDSQSA